MYTKHSTQTLDISRIKVNDLFKVPMSSGYIIGTPLKKCYFPFKYQGESKPKAIPLLMYSTNHCKCCRERKCIYPVPNWKPMKAGILPFGHLSFKRYLYSTWNTVGVKWMLVEGKITWSLPSLSLDLERRWGICINNRIQVDWFKWSGRSKGYVRKYPLQGTQARLHGRGTWESALRKGRISKCKYEKEGWV